MDNLIIIIGLIIMASHISTRIVYGSIISDDYLYHKLVDNSKNVTYNRYNYSIMSFGDIVITTVPVGFLCKFCIQSGRGRRISRFSKSHKLINEFYKKRPEF